MTADARLRVIIVDDEPVAIRGMRRLLEADATVSVVDACTSGRAAVESIQTHQPDLVFLDVQMPGMNGFDVLRALEPERPPAVVFVTAYDQFAIRAFEVNAVDYLLKPFEDERFHAALARARRAIRQASAGAVGERLLAWLADRQTPASRGPEAAPVSRLVLRETGRVQFVPTRDIDWIEAADSYVKLHVAGRTHYHRESLASLTERLAPAFYRVHRSALVNLTRIRELHPGEAGGGTVVLVDGTRLPLSRGRRDDLERRLERFRA